MNSVAFKVTYNDGGAGSGLLGFRGVCSNRIILENVQVRKVIHCSGANNPCRIFADKNFTGRRPVVGACYEASLFGGEPLCFGGGYYHNGPREGQPIAIKRVNPGDIAFLTTLMPGGGQEDRIVFACFRVGPAVYLHDGWGYVVESDGTMDVRFPDDVARQMSFWRYFQNRDESKFWGTGLFRYPTPDNTEALLADLLGLLGDHAERDIILRALGNEVTPRPVCRLPPVDGSPSVGGGYGGGEGEAHLNLKNFVAENPTSIGLPKNARASIEFPYLSGDQVDIKFDIPGGTAAVVEIETICPLPGAHQCIKYRALLEAALGHAIGSGKVEAILVAHEFDDVTKAFAAQYNISLARLQI